MPEINFIPPLRIEVRKKPIGKGKESPWSLLDTAHTEEQAEDKIRRSALPKEAQTRVVPNTASKEIFAEPSTVEPAAAPANEPPAQISDLIGVGDLMRDVHTGGVVKVTRLSGAFKSGKAREGFQWENLATNPGDRDHEGFCPRESLSCFVKISKSEAKAALKEIESSDKKETAPVAAPVEAAAAPVDALVGSTPLPFGPGDYLRDVHTGVKVRVTAINGKFRSGRPRAGFAWIDEEKQPGDKDYEGFCPLESVGCFEPVRKNAAATAEPTGKESPAPVVTPPAEPAAAAPAPDSSEAPPAPAPAAPKPEVAEKKSAAKRKPARATKAAATPAPAKRAAKPTRAKPPAKKKPQRPKKG